MYNNPCTQGCMRHPSRQRHRPFTHSLKMLPQNIVTKKNLLKIWPLTWRGHKWPQVPGVFGAILPMHHTIRDEFTWAKEGTLWRWLTDRGKGGNHWPGRLKLLKGRKRVHLNKAKIKAEFLCERQIKINTFQQFIY